MPGLQVEELRFLGLGPFSFELQGGECVGLSGPSGAGKTLLLRALVDLDPHGGTVRLNGSVDAETPPAEWRRRLGMLPANPQWWRPRVGDHLDGASVIELLQALDLDRDVLSWPVDQLSAGEGQRLALVRLLARAPLALLLDEPTSHLDAVGVENVERLVASVRRSRQTPVLWVSHDLEQLRRVASRVLRLEDGRLVERWP